jgi:hypothetical protein
MSPILSCFMAAFPRSDEQKRSGGAGAIQAARAVSLGVIASGAKQSSARRQVRKKNAETAADAAFFVGALRARWIASSLRSSQ